MENKNSNQDIELKIFSIKFEGEPAFAKPHQAFLNVFKYFSPKDLVSFQLVNHSWRQQVQKMLASNPYKVQYNAQYRFFETKSLPLKKSHICPIDKKRLNQNGFEGLCKFFAMQLNKLLLKNLNKDPCFQTINLDGEPEIYLTKATFDQDENAILSFLTTRASEQTGLKMTPSDFTKKQKNSEEVIYVIDKNKLFLMYSGFFECYMGFLLLNDETKIRALVQIFNNWSPMPLEMNFVSTSNPLKWCITVCLSDNYLLRDISEKFQSNMINTVSNFFGQVPVFEMSVCDKGSIMSIKGETVTKQLLNGHTLSMAANYYAKQKETQPTQNNRCVLN